MHSVISGYSAGDIHGLVKDIERMKSRDGGTVDAWFCLGDVLLPGGHSEAQEDERVLVNQLLAGQALDLPTYLVLRDHVHGMSSEALLESFQCSSKQSTCQLLEPTGMITLPSGLKIAFISGIDFTEAFPISTSRTKIEKSSLEHLKDLIKNDAGYVDLLFTFEWPKFICHGDPKAPRSYLSFGSELLHKFLTEVDARYIVAVGEGIFYEREPFLTPQGTLCRFLSLAHRRMSKEKSIHRLRIEPRSSDVKIKTQTIGSSPFSSTAPQDVHATERKRPDRYSSTLDTTEHDDHEKNVMISSSRPSRGYICNICRIPGHDIRDCPDRIKRVRSEVSRETEKKDCWFCLASPTARKHLIIDVGEYVYLALAYGPLTDDHILIIPIEHLPATSFPSETLKNEIIKYQEHIRRVYASFNAVPIFICLQQNPIHHWHMSCIAVDKAKIDDLQPFLIQRSAQLNYPLEVSEPSGERSFRMVLPNSILSYTFRDSHEFFPSQLGRQLIGEFLSVESARLDWRQSEASFADEVRQVALLKRRLLEQDQ